MSGKDVTVQRADEAGIAAAAAQLARGALVALPTETVYGLAARADQAEAVAQIYAAKGRPDFNPLIVHVAGVDAARTLAHIDARAETLMQHFWPGPLTLVAPLREGAPVAKAVTAGLPTIALRAPAHPVMRAVLESVGLPLAAPSANRSEHISPTRAEHVAASLAEACPMVLDGGPCARGVESTIVALRDNARWSMLRAGPIPHEELSAILGADNEVAAQGIEAPGQMTRHYSPGKPVRLNADAPESHEFMIGFGENAGDVSLSPSGDLNEAAARLYECLHQGEAAREARIAVAPIPNDGIGQAINDRLKRAAA